MKAYKNIILFVLDTVRLDKFSIISKTGENTPNLSEISKYFIRFENSISPATWTVPSHASIFSGLYPAQHKLTQIEKQLPSNIKTIAEQLASKGYINTIFTQNPIVGLSKNQLNKGFHNYYDGKTIAPLSKLHNIGIINKINYAFKNKLISRSKFVYSESIDIIDNILGFLSSTAGRNTNNFIFANLMLAHPPYSTDPKTFKITNLDARIIKRYSEMHLNSAFWMPNKISISDIKNLDEVYSKQLLLLDGLLGKFFSKLKEQGIHDNSAVIITSDHGDNLGERGILNHVFDYSDYLLKVPLLIHAPHHQSDKTITQRISNRRIFHTILDMAGFSNELSLINPQITIEDYVFSNYQPIEWGLSKLTDKQKTELVNQSLNTEKTIVYYNNFKFIFDFITEPVLFNLKVDPCENQNCYSNNIVISNRLLEEAKKFREYVNEYTSETAENILDDDIIFEHLRDLGYIE